MQKHVSRKYVKLWVIFGMCILWTIRPSSRPIFFSLHLRQMTAQNCSEYICFFVSFFHFEIFFYILLLSYQVCVCDAQAHMEIINANRFITIASSWMWLFALNMVMCRIDPIQCRATKLLHCNKFTVSPDIKKTASHVEKRKKHTLKCALVHVWTSKCALLLRDIA